MDSSLNLNTLANSLPNSNLANAEKDLLNNFKAAALSITTLYRSSRQTSKRAYTTGYVAACQDILLMIQQGVSTGEPGDAVSVGRIMDWLEARLDAVKAREEEEDEEEEAGSSQAAQARAAAAAAAAKPKPQPVVIPVGLATPNSPPRASLQQLPTTPSPSSSSSRLAAAALQGKRRRDSPPLPLESHRDNHPEPTMISTGAKRRHAVMMMLDPSAPSSEPGQPQSIQSSRRRTRSTRGTTGIDAMETEEDGGRERKRVARR